MLILGGLTCLPWTHDWAVAESWKWKVKVCRACGKRSETEKQLGGYSPKPDPLRPCCNSAPPRTTGTLR
jgi:hypothetical protein